MGSLPWTPRRDVAFVESNYRPANVGVIGRLCRSRAAEARIRAGLEVMGKAGMGAVSSRCPVMSLSAPNGGSRKLSPSDTEVSIGLSLAAMLASL